MDFQIYIYKMYIFSLSLAIISYCLLYDLGNNFHSVLVGVESVECIFKIIIVIKRTVKHVIFI